MYLEQLIRYLGRCFGPSYSQCDVFSICVTSILQVGTGYSFSDQGGLSTTEYEVAENLYSCLSQFFTVFSDYQNNDFYITGEVILNLISSLL